MVERNLVELPSGVLPALELVHQLLAQLIQADAIGDSLATSKVKKNVRLISCD
jgi:hypothetical protein